MAEDIIMEPRLYKHGSRWWLRMKTAVPGEYARRTTGTENPRLANRIAQMIESLVSERAHRDLVAAAVTGEIPLMTLYDGYASGNLDVVRHEYERAKVLDPDLEPFVETWREHNLSIRTLSDETRDNYVRQVRALIPEGIPFPCSKFTEGTVRRTVAALDVSDSTRCRYIAAWRLFCRFVRRNLPGVGDPFEFLDEWAPKNNGPRSTFHTHPQVLAVLEKMSGDAKRAMALTYGSGMELCALLAMKASDVLGDHMVIAHGTKNEKRRDRTIFVDAWAWEILRAPYRGEDDGRTWPVGDETLFPRLTENGLRNAFYDAQVAAGLVSEPARSSNGKKLWHSVGVHTIHDARHTYAITRYLGLDGAPPRSAKFVSMQLGHSSTQMVDTIYTKVNAENRLAVMQAEIRQHNHKEADVQNGRQVSRVSQDSAAESGHGSH